MALCLIQMKRSISVYILAAATLMSPDFSQARDATAKITFHLVTDEAKPLANFPYQVGSYVFHVISSKNFDNTIQAEGLTDTNGNVTLSLPSATGEISNGTKYGTPGFYPTDSVYKCTNTIGNKWQPWNPTIEVVVKPIINPIPMYARNVGSLPDILKIPAKDIPIGFDLMIGDFVAPYGKGIFPDFFFTLTEKVPFVSYRKPFDYSLKLTFNNKEDGILSVTPPPLNQGSALRLPRFAPESGYQSPLILEERHYLDENGQMMAQQHPENLNKSFFFRVRTVLDQSGIIKSALYGKISGPIQFRSDGGIEFTYYLNPTPNDRNMEFDPKRNLFTHLPPFQPNLAP